MRHWLRVGAAACTVIVAMGCSRGPADGSGTTSSAATSALSGASGTAGIAPSGATAAAPGPAEQPLVEEREDGSVAWIVRPDGSVRVTVRDATGKPVPPPDVEGTLTIRDTTTPMRAEGEALVGAVGKLEDDLTDIAYSLKVKGTPWSGMIQVPVEGTSALLAEPKVTVPPGTVGPNGGVVDVVGDQRVEIVANKETGELRVYLLDDKLEVMPVGDAEITVGIVQ